MLEYDPLHPPDWQDPYPTNARLREEAPVHYAEQTGTWCISRYADVTRVLRDLAVPLPVSIIAELLGVGPERHADFKRWSDDIIAGSSGGQRADSFALLDHPDELGRLQREPELLRNMIEEVLRYDAPVQFIFRRATRAAFEALLPELRELKRTEAESVFVDSYLVRGLHRLELVPAAA